MDAAAFGLFVQQCRKELGMTQADLAEKIYVTAKAVSRWERGLGFPDIKLLQPLADALEISLVELMQSKRLEGELSLETADILVTQTVSAIHEQEKLSRKQKWSLFLGNTLLGLAYIFLYTLAQAYPFEPKWLGFPILIIAIFGFHYGRSALIAIITGTKFISPLRMKSKMTWKKALFGIVCLAGFALLLFTMACLDKNRHLHDFLVFFSLLVVFASGICLQTVD